MPEDADLTIDELAREASLPTSTVRLYQHRGLLPSPERRGRVGYYGDVHRQRLSLIARLKDDGFSLAAIKSVIDAYEAGRSLNEVVGRAGGSPLAGPRPVRLSPLQLAQRFDQTTFSRDDLRRAVELGLIRIDGTDFEVANPAMAALGSMIGDDPVPVEAVLDAYEQLRSVIPPVEAAFRSALEADGSRRGSDGAGLPAANEMAASIMICELTASFRQLVVRWATGNDHVVDLEPARSSDEGTVDGPMAPPDPVRPPEQPSGIWLS